jgi:DNA-directed RNA polymerase subunit RPC12/RpoP
MTLTCSKCGRESEADHEPYDEELSCSTGSLCPDCQEENNDKRRENR